MHFNAYGNNDCLKQELLQSLQRHHVANLPSAAEQSLSCTFKTLFF